MEIQTQTLTDNLEMPIQFENLTLYSLEEVARVLNKHPNTIKRYIREGSIRAQKISGGWYVSRESLEEVVQEMNWPVEIIDLFFKKKVTETSVSPATA